MSPFRISRPRFLAYFLLESSLIFVVLYVLAQLTLQLTPDMTEREIVYSVASSSVLFGLVLLGTGRVNLGDREIMFRGVVLFSMLSAGLGLSAFATISIMLGQPRHLSALLLLEGAFAVPVCVGLLRMLFVRLRLFNLTRERVVIVGTGETAKEVCRAISAEHADEYVVIAFADEDESRLGQVLAMGTRIQTNFAALPSFSPGRADRIIVALDEKRGKFPVLQLMEVRLLGIEIEEATTFFERVSGKIAVETMLPSWLIFSDGFKTSRFRSALKRTADLVLSTTMMILTAPLMLLTAVAIKFDSHGPVLYRQKRLGRNRREIEILKFRSMFVEAEKAGPTWAREFDPRVTRLGRLIRKLRIDELPQLFNVFKGEMSFVGPRPEREHFIRDLEARIPYYALRMTVRPGLTGWAQVEYGYGSTVEGALEKLKYDLYYIKNNNLLLDMWICLKTVKVVLLGSGAR